MPKRYVGTKEVLAKPMTRREYNQYRNWQQPSDEDPNEEGYLVEYCDGGAPNDPRHVGYITYSPKDVFDRAYHRTDSGFRFGLAVEAMKHGKKVARAGWNGKGMYLYYVPEGRYPPTTDAGHLIAATQKDGLVPYSPYIAMKTVPGHVVPWLASQTDILADDWELVI